jgi:hypothetical protein
MLYTKIPQVAPEAVEIFRRFMLVARHARYAVLPDVHQVGLELVSRG